MSTRTTDLAFGEFAGIAVAGIVPGMAVAVAVADAMGANLQGIKDAAFLGMTAGPIALLVDKALKPVVSNKRVAAIWAATALTFGAVTGYAEQPHRPATAFNQSTQAKLAK